MTKTNITTTKIKSIVVSMVGEFIFKYQNISQ
jgi:hypothetical protein